MATFGAWAGKLHFEETSPIWDSEALWLESSRGGVAARISGRILLLNGQTFLVSR